MTDDERDEWIRVLAEGIERLSRQQVELSERLTLVAERVYTDDGRRGVRRVANRAIPN